MRVENSFFIIYAKNRQEAFKRHDFDKRKKKKLCHKGPRKDHFSLNFNDSRIHYSRIGNLTVDFSLNDLLFFFVSLKL